MWRLRYYRISGGGYRLELTTPTGFLYAYGHSSVIPDMELEACHYSAFCLESSCHTLSVVCPACWSRIRSRYTSAMRYVGCPWIPPAGFSWLRCTQLLNVFVLTICPVDCASRLMIWRMVPV